MGGNLGRIDSKIGIKGGGKMRRWASLVGALALVVAGVLLGPSASVADVTVTALTQDFETSVPPSGWNYGDCSSTKWPSSACVPFSEEYWDKRSVSEYPSGISPHGGTGMARWNAKKADDDGFGDMDELGYEGTALLGVTIPTGAINPVLKFWKYNQCNPIVPPFDSALDLQVNFVDTTAAVTDFVQIDRCDYYKPLNQWVEYTIDLSNVRLAVDNPTYPSRPLVTGAGKNFIGKYLLFSFGGVLDSSATEHRDILIDDVSVSWTCPGDPITTDPPTGSTLPTATKTLAWTATVNLAGGWGSGSYTATKEGDTTTGWTAPISVATHATSFTLSGTPGPSATGGQVTVRITDGCQTVDVVLNVVVQDYDCTLSTYTITPSSGALAVATIGAAGYVQGFDITSSNINLTEITAFSTGDRLPPGLFAGDKAHVPPGPAASFPWPLVEREIDVNIADNEVTSAQYPGLYTFQITATLHDPVNNISCTAQSGEYQLQVVGACPALALTPVTGSLLPGATVRQNYSHTISITGTMPDTTQYPFHFTATGLPAGLTISDVTSGAGAGSSAQISGRPDFGTEGGPYNITVTAIDYWGNCQASASYTLYVAPPSCTPVVLSPNVLPNGNVGEAYSADIDATGTAPIAFDVIDGSLPPGLSLDPSTGEITGVPTTTGTGTYTFTVRAIDDLGCPGQQTYSVSISCGSMQVSPATLNPGTVGSPYSQTFSVTGGLGPYTLSVVAGALPNGLSFADPLLSGTPTLAGSYNFTIRATDSASCSVDQPYTMAVNCPAISVTPATLPNGEVGQPYNQTLTASGGNSPYTFSLVAGTLPDGVSLLSDGRLVGTLLDDGDYTFTIRVTDSYGCTQDVSYSVSVGCPTISISPATLPNGTVGSGYTAALSASGGTSPYSFALSAGSLPDGLDLLSNGTITGTPLAAGTFNFTVQVVDSLGCLASQNYTVQVSCPTIFISPASLPAGTTGHSYNQTLNATGGTAPYTFQVISGSLPQGLSLAANGVLSGTPAVTSVGSYSFTVRATDANGCSATTNYTLQINPGWAPVSITSITKVPGTGFKLNVNGSGFQAGVVVKIGSQVWPIVDYKSSSQLRLKGPGLKALFPKGVPVTVTVTNPDGGTASGTFTR